MNKKIQKVMYTVLFCISAVALSSVTAFAHDTMSEFYPNPGVNEGVILFSFDNNELMSNVRVTVYDTFGEQIATDTTDAAGLFDFSGFDNVGHVIARYDDEHIQIHTVAAGGAYIVGQNFGGTYVSHSQLGELLRSFVLARYWLTVFVILIPAVLFAASLVFFVVNRSRVVPKSLKQK